jgi:hypothetical protein
MAILAIILGAIGGAIGMFFFDPRQGNRRRSLVRDQVVRFRHRAPHTLDAVSQQIHDKAQGVKAEMHSHIAHEPVSDQTLVQRVRSEMGRYVSHPGAITVTSTQGEVTISGAILTNEATPFIAAVMRLSGVRQLHDFLERHENPDNVPELQGGQTRSELL